MKAIIKTLNLINKRIGGNILLDEDWNTLATRLGQYGVKADTKALYKVFLTNQVK